MTNLSPPATSTSPQDDSSPIQPTPEDRPDTPAWQYPIPGSRAHSHLTRVGQLSRVPPHDLASRLTFQKTTQLARLADSIDALQVTQNNLRQAIEEEVRRTRELDLAFAADAGRRSDVETWTTGGRMARRRDENAMRVGRQAQVLRELQTRLRVTEAELEQRRGVRERVLEGIEATKRRMEECGLEVP